MWLRLMKVPALLKVVDIIADVEESVGYSYSNSWQLDDSMFTIWRQIGSVGLSYQVFEGTSRFFVGISSRWNSRWRGTKVLVGSESGPHCLLWLIPSVSEDFISTGRQNSVPLFTKTETKKPKLGNIRPLCLIPNVGDFSCNLLLRQNSVSRR